MIRAWSFACATALAEGVAVFTQAPLRAEHLATIESRSILRRLAAGSPRHRLTEEAEEALARSNRATAGVGR